MPTTPHLIQLVLDLSAVAGALYLTVLITELSRVPARPMPDVYLSDVIRGGIVIDNTVADYRIRTLEISMGGQAKSASVPNYAVNTLSMAELLTHFYGGHFANPDLRFAVHVHEDGATGHIVVVVDVRRVGRQVDRQHTFRFKQANEAFNDNTLATLSFLT